ncbi:MAG TPA: RT0821/Lpp0805 family surface protein [Acidisoma sp.]|uniref:RT0821/Lpp0805 family surface protein n=1 Tax=Acidisoma sp. TaxID=1872115 RepID=UPI002D0805E3|nr:RT0821/Lpp0805 family surface protein [Acidisoma sp.]HTI01508.1 RT0821/Lpp0805 family surface protein [Acidisoma sp.]
MSRKSLTLLTAALALGGLAAPGLLASSAQAQVMQSYLPRRLTHGDMEILRAEAAKLSPGDTKTEKWTNPKTRHSGTVTIKKQYEKSGMTCRKFDYTFHTGTSTDGLPYTLDWCRKPNGEWAIVNG